MGSSASKGARAAGSSVRKYPTRVLPNTTRAPVTPSAQPSYAQSGPSVHPPLQASETKSKVVELDARDPAFASRLNTLGAVQPNPHFSPSSTSSLDPQRNSSHDLLPDMMQAPPQSAFPDPRDNPALRLLEARQKIQEEAERDMENVGRRGHEGRKYMDAGLIQLALMRRRKGESDARAEDALGIRRGRLAMLGRGIVDSV